MPVKPTQKTVKILVVDDQAAMRLTLKGILTKQGYEVTVAGSGEEALKAVKFIDFRVVLMDVKMPGMSGVEAFLKIKEMSPHTTVILMTAYAVEEEVRKAIREGAYSVITKPFDMDRLLQIIQECLEDRHLIMVVDDRGQDRSLLKSILQEKGFQVVDVEDGEECLRQLRDRRFQIILLDIRLPGMNGLETLKRAKEIRPDVAVVMLTAYSTEEMVQQAMQHGSFACLYKPVDIEKLLSVMHQCLAPEMGKGEGPSKGIK